MQEIIAMDRFIKPVILVKKNSSELLCNASMMLIKGEVGSGKSRLVMNLMVGLLSGKEDLNLEYSICPKEKHVIYISTEMSKYHIQRRLLSVLRQIPEGMQGNLHFFDAIDSLDFMGDLTKIIEKYSPYVVIIDQLGDLIPDINNISDSTKAVKSLMNGIGATDSAIIGILHQNEDSGINSKARGHLGSMLEQKVVSSIAISDTRNGFRIKSSKVREGKQLDMTASFNEQTEMLIEKLTTVSKSIDDYNFPMSKTDLIKEICESLDCKERKAEDEIKKLLDEGRISSYKEGKSVFYNKNETI
jgi:hypothetical protein